MSGSTQTSSGESHGRAFLLLNLFGFPVFGLVARFMFRLLVELGAPIWASIAVPAVIGISLIAANFEMTRRNGKLNGWAGETLLMAVWTLACVIVLVMFSTFSPFNLALLYLF